MANNDAIAPWPASHVELYDPETNSWSASGPEGGLGSLLSLVKLTDGRVLAIGLKPGGPGGLTSVFDVASGSWTALPGPSPTGVAPGLALLADGTVLVAGRDGPGGPEAANRVDVFDPTTGHWRRAAFMNRHFHIDWLLPLNDGRVLALAAVYDESAPPAPYAEVYDPISDTWTVVQGLDPFYVPTEATVLLDGRVLVLGVSASHSPTRTAPDGSVSAIELPDGQWLSARQFAERFPDAKLYDPATNVWSPADGMTHARFWPTLTLLPDGRVLAAGGGDPSATEFPAYSTTDIFDPAAGAWAPGPPLSRLRIRHAATLLLDGRVLLTGGVGGNLATREVHPLASAELFDPAAAADPVAAAPSPTSGDATSAPPPPPSSTA